MPRSARSSVSTSSSTTPAPPRARRSPGPTRALLERMLAVNLKGAFEVSRRLLPKLRAAAAGRIVNVASTAGLKGYPYVSAYCAAKHGLIGLTRALAAELATTSVTVNAVCPGFTETALLERSLAGDPGLDRAHARRGAGLARPPQSAKPTDRTRGGRRGRALALPARRARRHRAKRSPSPGGKSRERHRRHRARGSGREGARSASGFGCSRPRT